MDKEKKILVSPSLLSADFGRLAEEMERMAQAGADWIHLDVMDGHFVPNISFGIPVLSSLRGTGTLFFDTHLMISDPARYAVPFVKAGAELLTFHVEIEHDVAETISAIRQAGAKVGLSLKPGTPADAVLPYLNMVDLILVMTVEPGFGGQKFMPDMLPKVRILREAIDRLAPKVLLEADGGIHEENAPLLIDAGANVLVAGTSIFKNPRGAAAVIRDFHRLGNTAGD